MAWPNALRQHDENTRNAWGHTFQWTPEHLTSEQLHPMKFTYDVLGEAALNRLDEISPPATQELPRTRSRQVSKEGATPPPKRDLYALLRDHASEDETLNKLWTQVNTIPDWVDWDQIARGQDVFYRYAGPALTALTYQSLLGGMGAQRVTEVLARTGGFSPKVAKGRMYETTQHILQVTSSLSAIQPGGAGFASTIRVRLLHSAVRRRIMKLAKDKPAYYSVEDFGIPINDLDSMGTINTFCATLIWLGFPRQGIFLRQQEIVDYLALWRLVGYYIGSPTDEFSTPERAKAMMESLMISEINPGPTSKIMANNIVLALQNQPPAHASRDFLNAGTRWLNGNELSDALGIGNPGWYYKALVAGQCLFFMAMCYTNRSIHSLDQRRIENSKKFLYHYIVENKKHGMGGETNFDFKYIPTFQTVTEQGEYVQGEKHEPGVERKYFTTLVVASAVVGLMSYISVGTTLGIVGNARALWFS